MIKVRIIDGKKLLAMREDRVWSQDKLVALSGVSKGSISKYENYDGGGPVAIKQIGMLAKAFKMKPAAFLAKVEFVPAAGNGHSEADTPVIAGQISGDESEGAPAGGKVHRGKAARERKTESG